MSESTKTILRVVVGTLNQINVSGKNNLDLLLGSIMALEKVLNEEVENDGNADG